MAPKEKQVLPKHVGFPAYHYIQLVCPFIITFKNHVCKSGVQFWKEGGVRFGINLSLCPQIVICSGS